ncbi:MAG: 3-dehydroquinate synthase [Candidatus Omnitrophica bacterium]|nr:3-dehydroquinate synthase [Candidatus Omnitrophota bacterium]
MKKISVRLKENKYAIIINNNLIRQAGTFIGELKIGKHAYVITNSLINRDYGWILKRSLDIRKIKSTFKFVQNSEKAKSIYTCLEIIKDILKRCRTDDIFIIAFGGGVIGDLAGFVASIYKRGVPFIQIPTTLLGQIDSGIGGKTAVNLKEAKNLIGTFYQPYLVLNDTSLLKTLDVRQIRSGIAEAIKYGVIKNDFILTYIENHLDKIYAKDEMVLEKLIYYCAKIKAKIVELDEKEKKSYRTVLNFGHTIGHALEAASQYKIYTHGEAIAIGMLVALEIGVNLGITSKNSFIRIKKLLGKVKMPIKINKRVSLDQIIQAYYYDKKFKTTKNRFVLIKDIGRPIIKENIPLSLIKKTIIRYY